MFVPKISIRKFYDGSFEFIHGKDRAKGTLNEQNFDWKLTSAADVEMMGRMGKVLFDVGSKGIKRAYSKRDFVVG